MLRASGWRCWPLVLGAVAGTPGATYITALHQLVTGTSATAVQAAAVAVFVLIEFSLVIIPFVFLQFRPEATTAQLQRSHDWLMGHARQTGTWLEQAALHVGPLSVSQPALVIIDPFASIALSVWLFDERFTNSPAKIAIAILSFAVMAAGVTVLSRTAPHDLTPSRPAMP